MGSRAGSREPEPKGFSGFGAEPRAEKFYRLRLSARLSALFILQNNWFLEKFSIKSNKSQIIGAVKKYFLDTLLNRPENRILGDQNFFEPLSTRYLGIFSAKH